MGDIIRCSLQSQPAVGPASDPLRLLGPVTPRRPFISCCQYWILPAQVQLSSTFLTAADICYDVDRILDRLFADFDDDCSASMGEDLASQSLSGKKGKRMRFLYFPWMLFHRSTRLSLDHLPYRTPFTAATSNTSRKLVFWSFGRHVNYIFAFNRRSDQYCHGFCLACPRQIRRYCVFGF